MKPEVKEKWIAALRSGEYRQARGVLNDGQGGYCCLGVLCEVAKQEGVKLITLERVDDYITAETLFPFLERESVVVSGRTIAPSTKGVTYIDEEGKANFEVLPEGVWKWAGLEGSNPNYQIDSIPGSLIDDNDSGMNFEEIAYIIENYL